MPSMPPFVEIQNTLLQEDCAVEFLLSKHIVTSCVKCSHCERVVILDRHSLQFRHMCKGVRYKVSVWEGTFFSGARIGVAQILMMAYFWLCGVTRDAVMTITGHSSHTVSDYYNHFCDLVTHDIRPSSCVIGGQGIIVEIDETKMGKRKYHRGHRVDGVWVVVGVERTIERKVFAVVVEDRSASTLEDIISDYVAPGSIIITDGWGGYSRLSEFEEIEHLTVNHSVTFRDPVTGAHTNTVEGTNSALKRAVPVRNRTRESVGKHLMKFIWMRQHSDTLRDSFIEALCHVEYE